MVKLGNILDAIYEYRWIFLPSFFMLDICLSAILSLLLFNYVNLGTLNFVIAYMLVNGWIAIWYMQDDKRRSQIKKFVSWEIEQLRWNRAVEFLQRLRKNKHE